MLVLVKLRKSTKNNKLQNASATAFWILNGNSHEALPTKNADPRDPPQSYEEFIVEPEQSTPSTAQVMISYQWNYKPIAVNIRDDLVANGYRVWMDITHMSKDFAMQIN